MKIREQIAKLQSVFFPPLNEITMEIGFSFLSTGKTFQWCLGTEKFSFDLTFADPSENQVFIALKGTIKALEIANPSLC